MGVPLYSKIWAESAPMVEIKALVEIGLTDLSNIGGEGGAVAPRPWPLQFRHHCCPINFSTNNEYISFLILKTNFEYHLYRPLFILLFNKRIKSHMRLTTMQSIILLLNGFKSMRHHIIMQKMLIQLSICQTVITL